MIRHTTIEQSKHLIELGLSLESADIRLPFMNSNGVKVGTMYNWSLGALLDVMPKIPRVEFNLVLPGASEEPPYIAFDDCRENHQVHLNFEGETPLEAAYNTVCWLLENGYIKKKVQVMKKELKSLRLPFLVWFILVIIMSVIKCF